LITEIADSKEAALDEALKYNDDVPLRVYCDGSGTDGGIGAAAVLYRHQSHRQTLHYHLGSADEHTVYEAECIGIVLALHMLINDTRSRFPNKVLIGSDNQAAILGLRNQRPHPGHWILDLVLALAHKLKNKRRNTTILFTWVPGHLGFEPNEVADEEAKRAARGETSNRSSLPKQLRGGEIPCSVSAMRQAHKTALEKRWLRTWKSSPRYMKLRDIDKSSSTIKTKSYLKLVSSLNRAQVSILTQLRTGHIGLNVHLFRIGRSGTPSCPHCGGITVESIRHFLFHCPRYAQARQVVRRKLKRDANCLPFLLNQAQALKPLMKYIHATKRFDGTFNNLKMS